jgi:hypothetical protein
MHSYTEDLFSKWSKSIVSKFGDWALSSDGFPKLKHSGMAASEVHNDIEKTGITKAEDRHVDHSSKDSSAVLDPYAGPSEDTTWKTWIVILVS